MNSRLIEVKNWEELAQAANYSASALSQRCQISTRQLERFFSESKRKPPHDWLNELRQERGLQLLRQGCSVKEAAISLGFKTVAHFSREFKRWHGFSPSHHRLQQIQSGTT
jgi:AraC-like DNA-binding protein